MISLFTYTELEYLKNLDNKITSLFLEGYHSNENLLQRKIAYASYISGIKQKTIETTKGLAQTHQYYTDMCLKETNGYGSDNIYLKHKIEIKLGSSLRLGFCESWTGNVHDNKDAEIYIFKTYVPVYDRINKLMSIEKMGSLLFWNKNKTLICKSNKSSGFKSYKIPTNSLSLPYCEILSGNITFDNSYIRLFPSYNNKQKEVDNIDSLSNIELDSLLGLNKTIRKKLLPTLNHGA